MKGGTMPLVNGSNGLKMIELTVEERQVCLVALSKFDMELREDRLTTIPGNTKEKEIDATRAVIKTVMGTLG
jgi:hypothetical protein